MASPTPQFANDAPLLTAAQVRAWKAEFDADVQLLAELPARIEAKRQRLEAAMMFLPTGFNFGKVQVPDEPAAALGGMAEVPAAAVEPARISWAGEMERILARQDRGIAHKELLALMMETELRDRATPGDKNFYNTIGRLAEKGVLVKSGGLLYHKDVADQLTARGKELPDMTIELGRRPGGSASFIIEALSQHPKGLKAPEIKKIVGAREDAPKSLREHGQYVYNILSTLMGNGTIKRRSGVYKLINQPQRSST